MSNPPAPSLEASELKPEDLASLTAQLELSAGLAFPYLQLLADGDSSDTAFHLGVKNERGTPVSAISLTQEGFVHAFLAEAAHASLLADFWKREFDGWVTGLIAPKEHVDALYPLISNLLPPLFVYNVERAFELSLKPNASTTYRIDPAVRPPEETDYTALCAFRLGQMIERYNLKDSADLRSEVMDQVERDWYEESLLVLKGGDGTPIGSASFIRAGAIARVDTLYMAPQWRGQGGGSVLLGSLIGYLQRSGMSSVTSTVAPVQLGYYADMLEQEGFSSAGEVSTLLFAPPEE